MGGRKPQQTCGKRVKPARKGGSSSWELTEGFKLGGGHREDTGSLLRFNISFANKTNFSVNTSTGVTLMHNTSWAVRGSGSVGFTLTTHATGADANFAYNNVSFEDAWPRARGDGTDDYYNTWNLDIDDPGFRSLDLASPDFLALSAGSAAVNAGMDVGLPYSGSAPDLGALQLGDRVILARAPDGSWRLKAWDVVQLRIDLSSPSGARTAEGSAWETVAVRWYRPTATLPPRVQSCRSDGQSAQRPLVRSVSSSSPVP